MSELKSLQRVAGRILVSALLVLAAIALVAGHPELVPALAGGGLLGAANLAWLVSPAQRLSGAAFTPRMLQAVAAVRLMGMGILMGILLTWGHVHPVGVIIGYACFPLALAAAGFAVLRTGARTP